MKYMPDMSKHFHHGTDKSLKKVNKEITKKDLTLLLSIL